MGAQVGLGTAGDASPPEAAEDYRVADLRHSVERAEDAAETPTVDLGTPGQARDERPEVLVVEDNGDMRRLLAFLLGREFRVRLAENGRRGLEAVRERAPDLVLSDVMMPEMSGLELCAALKADEATRGIPLVLVTSKAQREQRIEGLELGADDYLLKPFHPRELLTRVRSLVTLRRSRVELEQTLEALQQTTAQLVHSERLAAVGEMAAGLVHEVNNPVNFAMNAARAMSATVDDVRKVAEEMAALEAGEEGDELRRRLEALESLRESLQFDESAATLTELAGIVTDGLDRVATLVGELRDFARPGERERGPVDIARCLQTTLHLMGHTLTRNSVEIHSELPPTLPQVEGDARALNQVFLNVLKNAAEAFQGRGGSIWIRASAGADDVVTVTILDDGPGVPTAVREKLFEPFFTTKGQRGTGLGLSISRRIVEQQHGGLFELHSEPGEGTRVQLTIPIRPRRGVDGART
jgi:signal transduction histidine kinase